MATLVSMQQQSSGLRTKAYLGWSWTSFFFGGIPALFRGDFLGFFVWFGVALALSILTAGIGNVVLWIVWSVVYNKWHARRLLSKGYIVTAAAGMTVADATDEIQGV